MISEEKFAIVAVAVAVVATVNLIECKTIRTAWKV
jgi:hypothetical protein